MSNRGGGARWHLMKRAPCVNCGLVAPRGVHQIERGGVRCNDRARCEHRKGFRAYREGEVFRTGGSFEWREGWNAAHQADSR